MCNYELSVKLCYGLSVCCFILKAVLEHGEWISFAFLQIQPFCTAKFGCVTICCCQNQIHGNFDLMNCSEIFLCSIFRHTCSLQDAQGGPVYFVVNLQFHNQ